MGGWLVGNCDFNEHPVIHFDLDLDLGFVNMNGRNYKCSREVVHFYAFGAICTNSCRHFRLDCIVGSSADLIKYE